MPGMIKFGDVFRYNEEDFVYLANVNDILYAAKILQADKTRTLRERQQQVDGNPALRERLQSHILYCFVILTTPEYKDRIAHFKGTDQTETLEVSALGVALNSHDLQEMLDTILSPTSPLPQALKKAVKDITLEKQ